MTQSRLEQIAERAAKAAEGPWTSWSYQSLAGTRCEVWAGNDGDLAANGCSPRDAEFIANSRDDIPYLLAQLAEAEAREKRLREALVVISDWSPQYDYISEVNLLAREALSASEPEGS